MPGSQSLRLVCGALRQQSKLPPNSRLIHLHHSATTKHITGNHHIKEYNPFKFPHPKDYELELWSIKPPRKITQISLSQALEHHIKPGFALVPLDEDVQLRLPEASAPRYFIEEINTKKIYDPKNARSKGRGSKEFHFKIGVCGKHFAINLYKSYHFLSRPSGRTPVELHIHGDPVKVNKSKTPTIQTPEDFKMVMDKQKEVNNKFRENVFRNLHLWPQTILRAMPEGSHISIAPVTKDENVCWVMDLGGKDKTKLFEKNKKIHEDLYEQGLGVPDKETRRRVKLTVRQLRAEIRLEREMQKKKEKRERKEMKEREKQQKNQLTNSENSTGDTSRDKISSRAEDEEEAEPAKMSDILSPITVRKILKSTTFHSLVTKIDFNNLKSPGNSFYLEDLKDLIRAKLLKAGNQGLIYHVYLERLHDEDRHKIFTIALSEIRNRVAQIEEVREQGTAEVEEENLKIMERAKELFDKCENGKQLLCEARRRISEDLGKLKRENATKLQKHLLKMSRIRRRILDQLNPNEMSKLIAPEDVWVNSLPDPKNTYKSDWSWQSRGSSRSYISTGRR